MKKIITNEYTLTDSKIESSKIIANVSDIHGNIEAFYAIIKLISNIKPYATCIPGDTIDYVLDDSRETLLEKLKLLSSLTKVYIALGNHDQLGYEGKKQVPSSDKSFFEDVKNTTNCHVLLNPIETKFLDRKISISALNLPYEWYEKHENKEYFRTFLSNIETILPEESFNILLSHSPNALVDRNNIIKYSPLVNSANLILSGHNHGGLTPMFIQNIPGFHYGLVGPYAKIMQKNSHGFWSNDHQSLIVSNGVT